MCHSLLRRANLSLTLHALREAKYGCQKKRKIHGSEMSEYKEESVEKVENVLEWWKTVSSKYPNISMQARRFLAVPASSAASESVFSTVGHTLTDLRSSLSPDTLRALLFLRYNS